MRLPWSARVAIGGALGALGAWTASLLLGGWLAAALAGALLAPLVFLATFFIWSADVPPTETHPGHEQVLFDRPNVLASAALAVVLVGSAWGAGALGGGDAGAPPLTPEEAAYVERRDALVENLTARHDAFVASLDAYDTQALTVDAFREGLAADLDVAAALDADARALAPPLGREPEGQLLLNASRLLWESMVLMDECLGGSVDGCETMVIVLAESQRALVDYARLPSVASAAAASGATL